MKIRRIEHVAIALRDNRALKAVLGDVFGLGLEYEEEYPASVLSFYPVGETYLELLQPRPKTTDHQSMVGPWIEQNGEGLFHLCLEVDDIHEAVIELREHGLGLLQDEPVRGHGGCLVIFVDPKDTAGVLFELVELPAESAVELEPASTTDQQGA